MSESKSRLQRENDRLRAVEKNFEILLKAVREALWQHGLVDRNESRETLAAALAKMPPVAPTPAPPSASYEQQQHGRTASRVTGFVGAVAAFGGLLGPEPVLRTDPRTRGGPRYGR